MEDSTIIVGKKHISKYTLAVMTKIANGEKEVVLRGRSKKIPKTISVADILEKKHNMKIKDVKIGREEVNGKNMSFIEINMIRES